MDTTKNFAKGVLSTGYSSSATSIVLSSGQGDRFPSTAFTAVWWNATDYPDPSDDPNVEIVRVTARASDTLTITRGQEGTAAVAHNLAGKTYKLLAGLTAGMFNAVGTEIAGKQPLNTNLSGISSLSFTGSDGQFPIWSSADGWQKVIVHDREADPLVHSVILPGAESNNELAATSLWDVAAGGIGLVFIDGGISFLGRFNGIRFAEGLEDEGRDEFRFAIGAAALESPSFTGTPTAPTQTAGNNTTRLATTAFVQQEITSGLTSVMKLKGAIDCSTNPNYPSASAGWTYRVSVAGKIGGGSGVVVSVGDMIICLATNAGGTQASVGASWQVEEANLPGITTVGSNLLTLTDPGAVTFLRINADNTVNTRTSAQIRGDIGLGDLATQAASAVAITGGTLSGLSGLAVRSTGSGAFDLTLANTENLTAGRTLTLKLNDASRVVELGGNLTLGGAFTVAGAFATTVTATGPTALTLPTSGTLATLAGTEALTGKSVNGLTITTSSGTLTIANGKTLGASNSLTFTGTDASSVAFGSGGTVAYTASKLSAFAATTSSELAGVISDETGSGSLVFANSPTLVSPALGTPSALVLTNATGLPLATGATGTLPVAKGGTGATDAATAKTNLSVPGYTLTLVANQIDDPASSHTYYVGGSFGIGNFSVFATAAIRVPKSGIIKSVYLKVSITGPGGGAAVTHFIRINNTTDVAQMQGGYNTTSLNVSVDNVNQSVTAGDTIALKIVTPNWASAPTGVGYYCCVYVE